MGFEDEQDQTLKFWVYEKLQSWVYEEEVAVSKKMSCFIMGFNGFQEEEYEQKEWRMKMKQ